MRLFAALDLDPEARAALAAWRDELVAGRHDLRATAAATLHLTLAFMGWRDASSVPTIAACLDAVAPLPAPTLSIGPVRAVPAGRPRLFALDLGDPSGAAALVQSALSQALAAGGFYEPEQRPFWPHVTLARVRKGERAAQRLAEVPPPISSFAAPRVTLYRSTLRHSGAIYEALAARELA